MKALIKMILQTQGQPTAGVEVGVFRGENAAPFREAFPACVMLYVDPWQEWGPGASYHDTHKRTGNLSAAEWGAIYDEARQRINAAGGPSKIMRSPSTQGAKFTKNKSQDFVFIDADHSYKSVRDDIGLWLPKIKEGGLIAGHDYGGTYRGVAKAVNERFGTDNLILPGRRSRIWGYLVTGDD